MGGEETKTHETNPDRDAGTSDLLVMAAAERGVNPCELCGVAMEPALSIARGIARLRLRVRPGASRLAVLGRTCLAENQEAVALAISAPPEGGKANEAVIALLAKTWRIPKSRISIVTGATARTKVVEIAGEAAEVSAALGTWLATLAEV
jgi:uncharacterized protein